MKRCAEISPMQALSTATAGSPSISCMFQSGRQIIMIAGFCLLSACGLTSHKPGSSAPPPKAGASAAAAGSGAAGDTQARFDSALQLIKDQKPDEAQAALESLTQDAPNLSGPQTDLGILYARSKQRDKAIERFKLAVTVNPKNATAFDWLGVLYRENNDFAHAEQSYLQSLAIKPDNAAAQLNLAILYDVYLHRPQEAVKHYRAYQSSSAGNDRPVVGAWINELDPPAVASDAASTPGQGAKP